jgi:hypothetical protein
MKRHLPADAAREQTLAQHAGIRETLRDVSHLAEAVLEGRGPGVVRLRAVVGGLRLQLERHLAFEEAFVVPILARADPWGEERVKRLAEEHARQRQELAAAEANAVATSDLAAIAVALQKLAADLLVDMDEEERALLSINVLRDDLVSVDQETG